MPSKRRFLILLACYVALVFAAGAVWRAFNPGKSENPNEERQITSRQNAYYLCLHRPPMSDAQMYKLIVRKLPRADLAVALRGCREAQGR